MLRLIALTVDAIAAFIDRWLGIIEVDLEDHDGVLPEVSRERQLIVRGWKLSAREGDR